jgi:glycosyltransferase involved in cell wall biosynthesis
MEVTIVIPTYNGAHKIHHLLHALVDQTYKTFKVVVVIDGSQDETEVAILPFKDKLAIDVLYQENQGRSGAKNSGAYRAQNGLVIFYDDDMIPHPTSVEKHVRFHVNREGAVLGGNAVENVSSSKTDFQNYKAFLATKWARQYDSEVIQLGKQNLFLTAANCSMSKDTFNSVGGFNNNLKDAEDFDFAMRAVLKNIPVFFAVNNMATHNDPINCVRYIRRQAEYRKAHDILRKLYPDSVYGVAIQDRPFTKLKRVWYYMFSFDFWVSAIDNSPNLLSVLPQKLRYKIYDWVVYAHSVEYKK